MIISMAIHREQSIRSIQSNKSNCLLGIHTYYIYLSQYLASDQSGASTQCLEVNHSHIHSITSLDRGCNGGQIPTVSENKIDQ